MEGGRRGGGGGAGDSRDGAGGGGGGGGKPRRGGGVAVVGSAGLLQRGGHLAPRSQGRPDAHGQRSVRPAGRRHARSGGRGGRSGAVRAAGGRRRAGHPVRAGRAAIGRRDGWADAAPDVHRRGRRLRTAPVRRPRPASHPPPDGGPMDTGPDLGDHVRPRPGDAVAGRGHGPGSRRRHVAGRKPHRRRGRPVLQCRSSDGGHLHAGIRVGVGGRRSPPGTEAFPRSRPRQRRHRRRASNGSTSGSAGGHRPGALRRCHRRPVPRW